jgi:hypothetical protein
MLEIPSQMNDAAGGAQIPNTFHKKAEEKLQEIAQKNF